MVHLVEVPTLITVWSPGLYASHSRRFDDLGLNYGPPPTGVGAPRGYTPAG